MLATISQQSPRNTCATTRKRPQNKDHHNQLSVAGLGPPARGPAAQEILFSNDRNAAWYAFESRPEVASYMVSWGKGGPHLARYTCTPILYADLRVRAI